MFPGGHFFPVLTTGLVGGCLRWTVGTWWYGLGELERGLLRETRDGPGGSAYQIIGEQGMTDPGGGEHVSGRGQPAWQLPVGHEHGPSWASSMQAFLPLGSRPAEIHGQDNRKVLVLARSVLGRRNPIVRDSPIGMGGGSPSVVPPPPQCPELGDLRGGCSLLEGMVGIQGN